MIEKCYTIKELGELLGTGSTKTRDLVKDEPGVLKLGGNDAKRQTYRIPESVAQRIVRRSANPA